MEYPDLAPAINTYRNSADTLFGNDFLLPDSTIQK